MSDVFDIPAGPRRLGHKLEDGSEGPEEGEEKNKERGEEESKEGAAEAAGWESNMCCFDKRTVCVYIDDTATCSLTVLHCTWEPQQTVQNLILMYWLYLLLFYLVLEVALNPQGLYNPKVYPLWSVSVLEDLMAMCPVDYKIQHLVCKGFSCPKCPKCKGPLINIRIYPPGVLGVWLDSLFGTSVIIL